MRAWIGTLCLAMLPAVAGAQTLSGEYVFHGPNGPVRLVLEQAGGNVVTGVMRSFDGTEMQLRGELDAAGRVIGTITVGGGTGWFAAGLVEGKLLMAVAEIDPETGQPDMESGWSLAFERVGGASPGAAGGAVGLGPANPMGSSMGMQWGGAAGNQFGLAEDTPLIRQWRQHLSGKKLSYRDSYDSGGLGGYGGYSMRWDAYLCSDGTFLFQRASTVLGDVGGVGGYSHGGGMTYGTWRLVEQMGQVYIVYQMSDGTSDYAALRFENGATYLDRDRVYVTNDNPYCR